MAKEAKKTLASKIYGQVAAKHPDWSQARVYAVTRSILAARTQKATVNA